MTTTNSSKTVLKALVAKALNAKPATAEVVCFRLGLVINRNNMRTVRAALCELRAEGAARSHIIGGSQDVAYHIPA